MSIWDQILETFNKRNKVLTVELLQGSTPEREAVLMAELDRNMAQIEEIRTILQLGRAMEHAFILGPPGTAKGGMK